MTTVSSVLLKDSNESKTNVEFPVLVLSTLLVVELRREYCGAETRRMAKRTTNVILFMLCPRWVFF